MTQSASRLRAAALLVVLGASTAALAQAPPRQPATPQPPIPQPRVEAPGVPSPAAGPDTVLARVDGQPITERDIAIAAEDLGSTLPQMTDAQRRDYLIGYLADLRLGAKAAAEAKIADEPEVARKLGYARDKALIEEYLTRQAKAAINDEAMRKLYEEVTGNLKPEMELRARHILVEGEDEAKKAQARVTTGKEDFAKVAGELSKDPGSGKEGGDLGFFTRERMVPEFSEAAYKLEPGQVSAPVKSQFGWHVIKLEEKRMKPAPAFEDVKEQIQAYLTRKAHADLILALREKGNIERLDQPAGAAAGAPAAGAQPRQ